MRMTPLVEARPEDPHSATRILETSLDEERRLLLALRGGDRAAAETLVTNTYRAVFAFLVKLSGDREEAADVTQETYRKAWEALDGFQGESRLPTWLTRIAYTTYLNHIRRPRRAVPLAEETAVKLQDPSASPEESAARAQGDERLRRAVLALPEELRFTVTALYFRGLSVAEVAKLSGITGMAVRKRLKRALAALEAALCEV